MDIYIIYIYIYIYIYKYKINKNIKNIYICLTNFRILIVLNHVCEMYVYIYIYSTGIT